MPKNLRELYQHVSKNHSIKWIKKGHWEVRCWLGKEPNGRLFKIKQSSGQSLYISINQLANDMWDFLFTKKGEEIIRKEEPC